MPNNCAVKGCKNTTDNCRVRNSTVRFYSFPNRAWEVERRKTWTKFCKREAKPDGSSWEPSGSSKICSIHFVGGIKDNREMSISYNPTIDSSKPINENCINNQKSRSNRYFNRLNQSRGNTHTNTVHTSIKNPLQELCNGVVQTQRTNREKSSQTEGHFLRGGLHLFNSTLESGNFMCEVQHNDKKEETTVSIGKELCKEPKFSGFKSMNDPKVLLAFTGVSEPVFEILVHLLSKTNSHQQWNMLSVRDRMLLVLTKLRNNLPFVVLGPLFNVSAKTAAKEFTGTISTISQLTKDWIPWLSQDVIRATTPPCFLPNFENVRVIIDCSEIRCEIPDSVDMQNHLYSSYKSSHTVKFLIGVSPAGLITYFSSAYGGRSTDSEIAKNCGLLKLLEPGDIILADKGFPNIQLVNNSVIVMPPFSSRHQKQFTVSQMETMFSIANVRIHVERVIGRMKKFRILQDKITRDLLPKIDSILHICAVIVNLSRPIAPNK